MSALGGQDGAGGSEVVWVGDLVGGTEVSGNTDTLEELRGGDEALDVLDTEVVCAGLDGVVTDGLGEEGDV